MRRVNPLFAALLAAGVDMTSPIGEPVGLAPMTPVGPRQKKKPRVRLQIARGAGTISAKADVAQLANLRRYKEAAQMVEDHRRQCGEQLYPQNVVDCWKATEYSA